MSLMRIPVDVQVGGNLTMDSITVPDGSITREQIELEALANYSIPLTDFRVWDALPTVLPATSATDDLGLYTGTYATDSPLVRTSDLKGAGATTRYARVLFALPVEYDAGETVYIRLHAGMITTVSDTTATIDVQCYENDGEGGISADLCATAATTINSLTWADKDFTLTTTNLAAGDMLDIRIAIAINDGATGTEVAGGFGSCEILCDIRG